jgi:hypothetical protein
MSFRLTHNESQAPRKQFFFEKKNQKTFTRLDTRKPTNKSFLFLFFKKEILPYFSAGY